jgi:hypothetical protein
MPVIAEELADTDFEKTAALGYRVFFDPASNVAITRSLAGIKLVAPTAPLSTVSQFVWDAIGKTLTVAVDGTAPKVVNLASLDDEGVRLQVAAGQLNLLSADGSIISSTPITSIDAQQLTGVASATGYTLNLTNGGSATLTCANIGQMYPTGAPVAATELLSKDCKAVAVSALPINATQLVGVVPAANTAHTMAIAGANLTSTVNGVVATVPLASIVTCATIRAAYPAAVSPTVATANLLTDACTKVAVRRATSSFGTNLNYWVLAV